MSTPPVAPDPRADHLTDPDELLHRQVHPQFIQAGKLSSRAFLPFPKDHGQLSVDRDRLATAEDAFARHTVSKGLDSAGTWSVTVGECDAQGLPARSDPIEGPPANPAHCLIDFTGLPSQGQVKRGASALRDRAEARGATFAP